MFDGIKARAASTLNLFTGPGSRFNPLWALEFKNTRQPSPGAQSFAYTNLGLVEFTPIGGGTSNRAFGSLKPLQPPTLFADLAVKVQGLGGLATGQFIMQPLVDPNNPPAWDAPVL